MQVAVPAARLDRVEVGLPAQGQAVFAAVSARVPVPRAEALEAVLQAAVSAAAPVAAVAARPERAQVHPRGEARSATAAGARVDAGRPAGVAGTSKSSKLKS